MTTEGNNRSRVLLTGLVVAAVIILCKLFYIQIIDDKYKINASNNSMVYDIIYPTRGIIYDRNGKLLPQYGETGYKAFWTLKSSGMAFTSEKDYERHMEMVSNAIFHGWDTTNKDNNLVHEVSPWAANIIVRRLNEGANREWFNTLFDLGGTYEVEHQATDEICAWLTRKVGEMPAYTA